MPVKMIAAKTTSDFTAIFVAILVPIIARRRGFHRCGPVHSFFVKLFKR
jgi:hypothetical protein